MSSEANAGDTGPLDPLHSFLPDNRLLAADCSRYSTHQPRPATEGSASDQLVSTPLAPTIECSSAVTHGHQWLGWVDSSANIRFATRGSA